MTVAGLPAAPEAVRVRVMNTSKAADLYLGELARQGKSRTTINRYRRQLDKLADMYPWHDVDELDVTMLRRYLDREAKNQRDPGSHANSSATVAQKISILKAFFRWLFDEGYVPADPSYRLKRPKLLRPEENDQIVSVSGEEVGRMLAACQDWRERICLNVLAYTGARRHAVALLRLSDYDATADPPTLRFREKGGKTIVKPISDRLASLLDAAYLAGVWAEGGADPWLIPPRGTTGWARHDRYGETRDDRIVWRTVKDVADRAGVRSHVHALRAAFAVFFLEHHPDQLIALQSLMGHSRLETTNVYLRRLSRRQAMETVRDLDWGAPQTQGGAKSDNLREATRGSALHEMDRNAAAGLPTLAVRPLHVPRPEPEPFQSLRSAEKEGFEPSEPVHPGAKPQGQPHGEIDQALADRAKEQAEASRREDAHHG